MAKLVDALCSGRSARKGVLVRIQFWAQKPYRLSVYKVFSFHQLSSPGKRMQPILSKRLYRCFLPQIFGVLCRY